MTTTADVLDKIRKLLRMAQHQTSNPHEAALAASHAQRLMDEHNLSAAMLDLNDETAAERVILADGTDALDAWSRVVVWKARLAVVVAKANACESIVRGVVGKPGRRLALIGRPSDIAATRYIYAFIVAEADRLVGIHGRGQGATWRNNYLNGIVDAVEEAFDRQRDAFKAEHADQSTALMRIDAKALQTADAARRILPNTRERTHMHTVDDEARALGHAHGQRIRVGGQAGQLGAAPKVLKP